MCERGMTPAQEIKMARVLWILGLRIRLTGMNGGIDLAHVGYINGFLSLLRGSCGPRTGRVGVGSPAHAPGLAPPAGGEWELRS